jgi:lysophospholipase L1-like esterase
LLKVSLLQPTAPSALAQLERLAIVAAPFRFQLEEPALPPTPQETLARWAHERGVPFLDLLPALREIASQLAPGDLFLDHCHFTVAGHAQVARLVADWLAAGSLAPAEIHAGRPRGP